MLAYALTLFTSAFLLFLVQPLIGKFILPWFGGAPSVWTCCMLFFQATLLCGYAYAHGISTWLSPRRQAWIHLGLLALALVCLPITPSDFWKPAADGAPAFQIVLLLLACVGLPFFTLSATGPLLQSWLGITHPGRSPYPLYALSNVGSFIALLAYPFWVETHFGRQQQTLLWSVGFAVFVVGCGYCAWRLRAHVTTPNPVAASQIEETSSVAKPTWHRQLAWLLLPTCASALLLATTNVLCQDMAVTPFLWVLPLALYLLSFVICFAGELWYSRIGCASVLVGSTIASLWSLNEGAGADIDQQVLIHAITLLSASMVLHGELFKLRPAPRHLTRFYLIIAAGGCLGGLFVAIIAPLVFSSYAEWEWSLGATLFLFAFVCLVDQKRLDAAVWRVFAVVLSISLILSVLHIAHWTANTPGYPRLSDSFMSDVARFGKATEDLRIYAALLLSALGGWLVYRKIGSARFWHLACSTMLFGLFTASSCFMLRESMKGRGERLEQSRSFYGVLTLLEYSKSSPKDHSYLLRHGRITHGMQLQGADRLDIPTTYYSERSGVAHVLRGLPEDRPHRIGVVGLGAGTLAAYARAGDIYRFYDINPEVVRIAREKFRFLSRSPATIEIALGDARLNLEREKAQNFDVLVLDAFSSDSIPIHLLTKEAFAIYLRHLAPRGILAVHTSNRFLELESVVAQLKVYYRLQSVTVSHFTHHENTWDFGSTWVLLAADAASLDIPELREDMDPPDRKLREVSLWTDDSASILPLLR